MHWVLYEYNFLNTLYCVNFEYILYYHDVACGVYSSSSRAGVSDTM